ncbi:MAG TPA: hypothetical protein PKH50_01925 [bacterium]|jgi:hypothetical protein|nr:hypothetical protein [bacterium]
MQTQNQKYIKWIPKKDVYTQKALKKNKADVFVPKEARKKFEVNENQEKRIERDE